MQQNHTGHRNAPARNLPESETELIALRADNEFLRAQLALRDQALDASQPDQGIDASYLASLNAPFDWQGAQSRVANALRPT